jgi:FkbM family methyltransferase
MIEQRLYAIKDTGFHPDKVLDVGCHVGDMATKIKEIWPYTDVLCVDANPYLEETLTKKGLNFKIVALSNEIGVKKNFWVSTEWVLSSGNSLYRENTPSYSDDKCKTIEVYTDTLDHYFCNDELFDFIKIDTQGSEVDILSGGKELIQKAKYILTESAVHEYNLGGNTIAQMIEFMTKAGFTIEDICDYHYDNKNVLVQVDLLFKKI